jgi:hypothetical protein
MQIWQLCQPKKQLSSEVIPMLCRMTLRKESLLASGFSPKHVANLVLFL